MRLYPVKRLNNESEYLVECIPFSLSNRRNFIYKNNSNTDHTFRMKILNEFHLSTFNEPTESHSTDSPQWYKRRKYNVRRINEQQFTKLSLDDVKGV